MIIRSVLNTIGQCKKWCHQKLWGTPERQIKKLNTMNQNGTQKKTTVYEIRVSKIFSSWMWGLNMYALNRCTRISSPFLPLLTYPCMNTHMCTHTHAICGNNRLSFSEIQKSYMCKACLVSGRGFQYDLKWRKTRTWSNLERPYVTNQDERPMKRKGSPA